MPEKRLHIIAFDIPYPPNYGGVIDVFFKIKTLHGLGIKICLHCFEYPGRERSEELNEYCEEVNYYPRKTGLLSALNSKPYIVSSRRSEELMKRLLKDDHPIIFEGLHSCYYISDTRIRNRVKIYRESNIEHLYYFNLFKVDRNIKNKIYFLLASLKLKIYQKVLQHANLMLAVSQHDTDYLRKYFPDNKVVHIPSFHANSVVSILNGKGDYALYHGNIEVPENEYAARYLVNEIFHDIDTPLVIAGMKPREQFRKLTEARKNVTLIPNPDDEHMIDLIRKAHVNVLVTFQATGLKLKLLNTLYNGRFCLVNDAMILGTTLGPLCEIGNTAVELKNKLKDLFEKDFGNEQLHIRQEVLTESYDNETNGRKLIDLIF